MKQIEQSKWKRPAELQGKSAEQIAKTLTLTKGDADRIARLLERSGRMALELESIFARGMWVVTRMDALYPAKLCETLKHQAPTVLFGAGEIELLSRGEQWISLHALLRIAKALNVRARDLVADL